MAAPVILLPPRFEVLRELGSGGSSVVFHARDLQHEAREVAVKVLVKERLEDRFSREAESLAQLSHPNLVRFMEIGRYEGRDFLVMEYLPGGDLASHLRGKGSDEILRLFIEICDGLSYLHSRGIVHRDIKPANILIDAQGKPRLTDLGTARQVDRKTRITKAGSILGTYAYLAPEQIQSMDAGPAADLYSLGVCLFEALTGRRPFTVKHEFKLLKAHLEESPPSLHKFRPELPDSLESLVASLLEKTPEARPTTAEVVARMLERCLSDLQAQSKRTLVDHDPEAAIESLSEAQRSVLLVVGFLGERATFAEICGASAFAEDRTEAILESLVEAKLLTCPDRESFVLTFPRRLALGRITPRVRDLFHARLVVSGQTALSSGVTTAGMTTVGASSSLASGTSVIPESLSPPVPAKPLPEGRRTRFLGVLLALVVLGALGWVWSNSAELVVASFPDQASVIVDGEWKGRTPTRVRSLLPGRHTVRVVMDGYVSEVREVHAQPLQPIPMDFTLKESRGRLTLRDLPMDSQLTVNGAVYDAQDAEELSVPAGRTRIKVVRPGFRTFFRDVVVAAGQPCVVKVDMSPVLGQAQLTSSPAEAFVRIDGKESGKTPLQVKDLSFGSHLVEFSLPGHCSEVRELEVQSELPYSLHVALLPLSETPAAEPSGVVPAPSPSPAGPTPQPTPTATPSPASPSPSPSLSP